MYTEFVKYNRSDFNYLIFEIWLAEIILDNVDRFDWSAIVSNWMLDSKKNIGFIKQQQYMDFVV